MASVELRVMEQLLAEIDRLEKMLSGLEGVSRATHSDVQQLLAKAGMATGFDAGQWSRLSADEQNGLLKRLTKVRDDLLGARAAQPVVAPIPKLDADSLSRQTVIWLAVFAFVFIATLLSLLR